MTADRHSDADLQVIDRLLAAAERAEAEARREAEGLRLARQRRLRELEERTRGVVASNGAMEPDGGASSNGAPSSNGATEAKSAQPVDGVATGISPKAAAWLLPRIEGSLDLPDATGLDRDALVGRLRAAERESELASVSDALTYLQGQRRANGAER